MENRTSFTSGRLRDVVARRFYVLRNVSFCVLTEVSPEPEVSVLIGMALGSFIIRTVHRVGG